MNLFAIAGTPAQVPYPLVWDGSLWTLSWEFLCYTGIAVLAVIGLLSHRRLAVALTATTWLIEMYAFLTPTFWPNAQFALRFAVIFLTGALAFLYRDVLVDSGRLAIALLASACLGFMIGHPLSRVSGLVTGPALVYPILWLAAHLRFRKVGAKNDLSYGFYIYAFPVAQLLALAHVQRYGYIVFVVATVASALPFAMASWFGIEKWALRARNLPLLQRYVSKPAASSVRADHPFT